MAVNMDKLNPLIGKLAGAVRAGVVVIAEKLKLYRAFPKGASKFNQVLRRRLIAAAILSCLLSTSSQSYSERVSSDEDRVALELSALGKRGEAIARARKQVLGILQPENACSAWFQEADSAPAQVFQSVHFELDPGGTSVVYGVRDRVRGQVFKHPWAARTTQNAGRDAIIELNGNGAFFNRTSLIMQLDPGGGISGIRWKSSFDGFSLHRGHSGSANHDITARTGAHHRAPSGGRRLLGWTILTKHFRSVAALQD